jgi:hypothetical protein
MNCRSSATALPVHTQRESAPHRCRTRACVVSCRAKDCVQHGDFSVIF